MASYLERFLGLTAFPEDPLDFELELFRLDADDVAWCKAHPNKQYRTGRAINLAFMRATGAKLEYHEHTPKAVLQLMGELLDVPPMRIATLRAIYRRRQTLWSHQRDVMDRLGLNAYSKLEEKKLQAFLKDAASSTTSVDRLVQSGREWLRDRKLLIPADSTMRDYAVRAMKESEYWMYTEIRKQVSEDRSKELYKALMEPCKRAPSVFEWLQRPPGKKIQDSFRDMIEKGEYLKKLGMDQIDLSILPQERVEWFYQRLQTYRPSRLKHIAEPGRTIHIVCFLRTCLGRCEDVIIRKSAKAAADVFSEMHRQIKSNEPKTIKEYKGVVKHFIQLIVDQDLSKPDVQSKILEYAGSLEPMTSPTRAAEIRSKIAEHGDPKVRTHLRLLVTQNIKAKSDDPILKNLEKLSTLYGKNRTELPETRVEVPEIWDDLVNQSKDRKKALHALEYSVLADLRKKFRSGACWIDTSSDHRNPEEMLISKETWAKTKKSHYDRLRLPINADDYLKPLVALVIKRVEDVAKAVKAGNVKLSGRGISYPDDDPIELMGKRLAVKKEILKRLPIAQLPDILIEVDLRTRFSTKLLGRTPRSQSELMRVYAGILALGTDMQAKGIAKMIPGMTQDAVAGMMRELQLDNSIPRANAVLLDHFNKLPLAAAWGDSKSASADMMAMPTSKTLWNSRVDYRRKTPSIGLYDHILNNRAYVYNQPIVLGNRQVGAAIHGVVSQTELEISRLAVDTHGYTDIGMAIAAALGFDLCPRIRNLRERRLCLPKKLKVNEVIAEVVDCGVNLDLIRENWDDFVRVVASISNATCSAVTVLERFGSAAQGNLTYLAGKHLGRLRRTLFLCDYLLNDDFRAENRRLLTQGEQSHNLKRAIYSGAMSHERGRDKNQLFAISGALNLLANIVQYWNTLCIQKAIDVVRAEGHVITTGIINSVSPCRSGHINLRGEFNFKATHFSPLIANDREYRKAA